MTTMIDFGTKTGTAGGTLLAIVVNINSGDLLRTLILASVGATVSFVLSLVYKRILKIISQNTRAKSER